MDEEVGWSIQEVARLSAVTSRTLRHYHQIGLLRPAWVGANGHRYYRREQLLRLQQILLLRELGLGLDAIANVLDGELDRVQALRRHRRWLLAERDRLDRLAATVSRTIDELEGGDTMPAEDLFDGLEEKSKQWEADLVARYGEEVRAGFTESRRRTRGWTRQDYLRVAEETARIEARLLDLLRSGAAPDDAEVFDALDEHHAGITRFWTPDRASYAGLGQLYVDHPDFRARYDAMDPRLAEFLRDAMAAYAAARLT